MHQLAARYILLGRLDEADSFLSPSYLKGIRMMRRRTHARAARRSAGDSIVAPKLCKGGPNSACLPEESSPVLARVMQPLAETAFVKQQMSSRKQWFTVRWSER
ncbi:MAG: hypothetical protein R3B91_04970 [Planctomycetaceae bacterium]